MTVEVFKGPSNSNSVTSCWKIEISDAKMCILVWKKANSYGNSRVELDDRVWKFVLHVWRGKFNAPCLVSECGDSDPHGGKQPSVLCDNVFFFFLYGCFYSYVRDNHMWKCRVHVWPYFENLVHVWNIHLCHLYMCKACKNNTYCTTL